MYLQVGMFAKPGKTSVHIRLVHISKQTKLTTQTCKTHHKGPPHHAKAALTWSTVQLNGRTLLSSPGALHAQPLP